MAEPLSRLKGLSPFPIMKTPLARILALLLSALPLAAVNVGDKLDSVLAEKGVPASRLERGATILLTYPDATIRLKDGAVVEIKAPAAATKVNTMPVPKRQVPAEPKRIAVVPPGQWTNNYQVALNTAQATSKKVFVLFTGRDWCTWCQKLEREILATAEFNTYAAENLVLVMIDLPRQTQLPDNLKAQNDQLAQAFGVTGFPTIIVLSSDGQRIGQLGYMKAGVKPFLARLGEL